MSKKHFRLNWKGDQVIKITEENACKILGEFALVAEGESKKELQKGHGVLTGTLRRSIHAASPDYEFSKDNVESSGSSPERGGKEVIGKKVGGKIMVLLGSGLRYAMAIHQGWSTGSEGKRGSFDGYHYLVNGLDKAKAKLGSIIERHQAK